MMVCLVPTNVKADHLLPAIAPEYDKGSYTSVVG